MKIALRCAWIAFAVITTSALYARPATPQQAGWLGMGVTYHQTDGRPWLLVAGLEPGGPAERAGLRVQDVIVAIDGRAISFPNELHAMAFFLDVTPRRTLRFTVARQNRKIVVSVTAVPLPSRHHERWKARADFVRKRLEKKN